MLLTGKAREDFLKWKAEYKGFSTIEVLDFNHLSKVTQNAIIVEFLNTIEYRVWTLFDFSFKHCFYKHHLHGYIIILDQAIIKANEIYNYENR